MKLTKSDIEKLEMTPELKVDILGMFDEVESKQKELDKIRAKLPTDSQKVVENVDYAKFEQAQKDLEALRNEMASKLAPKLEGSDKTVLSAFAQFFSDESEAAD